MGVCIVGAIIAKRVVDQRSIGGPELQALNRVTKIVDGIPIDVAVYGQVPLLSGNRYVGPWGLSLAEACQRVVKNGQRTECRGVDALPTGPARINKSLAEANKPRNRISAITRVR